jgi:hypothetical protein
MRISSWSLVSVLAASLLSASLPAGAAANSAPTIVGTPAATTFSVPTYYSFQPSARDAQGNHLTFSIQNMPSWGTFNPRTGLFRGWVSKWYEGREFPNIVISVSDGQLSSALPPFTVKYLKAGSPANTAPSISGTPATSVTLGQGYAFQPSAKDAQGDALAFSIQNKPRWASFSTATGALSGTPTAAGSYGPISITVSDGQASASLAAFSILAQGATRAPTLSGTAKASLSVGEAFAFQPTATGTALTFGVQNCPAWAAFNPATGKLSGTPSAADVGTFANITVSVTDGTASASLSFSLTVTQISLGTATVTWAPPTQNVDGSAIKALAGYRILYGTVAGKLTQSIEVKNAGLSSLMVENLSPATYYFAVKAFTADGTESDSSNVASKIVY